MLPLSIHTKYLSAFTPNNTDSRSDSQVNYSLDARLTELRLVPVGHLDQSAVLLVVEDLHPLHITIHSCTRRRRRRR